jgi:PKD repeat protein
VPLFFSADFKDADLRDIHKATWAWGDDSEDAGSVNEKSGTGSVSGQHTYRSAGHYTIRLTVTDSSGKSATVHRKLAVRNDR